jgi:hypothetical protein
MKTPLKQAKWSGVALIEILGVVAVLIIVSASIRFVSDRGAPRKTLVREATITNASLREIHAPRNGFHTHEAPRQ